ncbi:hypothetical protein [Burkholderia sola]|uniref:hypothetical protein n=1 Tax=Burkholderia sola TaxID=2843302 RepID=UPI001C33CB0C|nr:hypothetical protein BCCR75389_05733 [Burkholderia cenocepacia]CAG2353328.1 hypothetical protein BCCR75388_05757 [Burkholderia cenocepacia]CAG2353409.1 hypothetical protein BCCR75384_05759 [Burkholderia cenocepacia]CAG2353441.1 hypothetical protein BCCR75386_05759 [Burkholderia cenocepacia]CAG2353538.1 hypothetical protein BCCR75387_05755 [Burkholderia cenocepacia]
MTISNSTQVRSSSLDLPRNDTQPAPAPRQRSASMTGPRPSGGALLGALSNAPAFPAHTGTDAPAPAGPLSTTSQPAGTAQPPSPALPAPLPVRRKSLPPRASSSSGAAIGREGGGSRSLPGSGKLSAQRAALGDETVPVLDLSGGGQSSEELPVHDEPQPHTPASEHDSAAPGQHQELVETKAAGKQPATSRSSSPLPLDKGANPALLHRAASNASSSAPSSPVFDQHKPEGHDTTPRSPLSPNPASFAAPHRVAHDIDIQDAEIRPEATVPSSSSRIALETRTLAAGTSVAEDISAVAEPEDTRPASAAAISDHLSAALSRPGQIRSFISNVGDMLTRNPYGAAQPLKGWTANLVNAFSHEFVATGGATLFRELCSMATEAVLDKTGAGPETRGVITASLFTAAAMGNLVAMLHKYHTGTADTKTYAGHGAQLIALITTVGLAAHAGKNDEGNGHLGQLAGMLPSAIKSYAYLARDVINVFRPLEGNHDAGYEHPVRGQALNGVPYFGNQLAVNTAQASSQWSATSYVDSLIHHTKTNAAIKGLFGYSAANAAGEGLDAIGGRVASEISTHGFTGKALDELKSLRLSWGKIDTSETSTARQLGDKAAGAGIARLSLFLSLYAATAVVNHAVGGRSDWSAGDKNFTENALGALLIIAGCLPFAASTSSPSNRSNERRTVDADNAMELGVMHRTTA